MEWLTGSAVMMFTTWLINTLKRKFNIQGARVYWLAILVCFIIALPATLIAGQWGITQFDFTDPPTFINQLLLVFGVIFTATQTIYNAWKVLPKGK